MKSDLVLHHPHGLLGPQKMNLQLLTPECHRGDHKDCHNHKEDGTHECQCHCHE